MAYVFELLVPKDWIGVLYRTCLTVFLIFLTNLWFGFFVAGDQFLRPGYYFLQVLFVGGPFVTFFYSAAFYQYKIQKRLSLLSRKDGLTGLNNRRTYLKLAAQRLLEVEQGVVLLLDADHFKRINDTYGHSVGDQCLEEIAYRLKWNLRKNDVAGRLGGEEFSVLLADATVEQARVIAGRIGQPITYKAGDGNECRTLTLSIGAAAAAPTGTLHSFLVRADDALYEAKRTGRAKTVFWTADLAHIQPHELQAG